MLVWARYFSFRLLRRLALPLALGLISCSPPNSDPGQAVSSRTNLSSTTKVAPVGTQDSLKDPASPKGSVSAFTLDDKKFSLVRLAVGLQSFMNSQTPVLSYKIPEQADYVEILRCRDDVQLITGLSPVSLIDVELASLSDAEKAHLYRSNDYFKAAEDNKGCTLISDGHAPSEFFDSFAPSGSFRYLVRACVNPKRLVDTEKLSARNCSRRVAISTVLADYKSSRKKKEAEALRLASVYGARIEAVATTLRFLAQGANQTLNDCEERNHARLVDVKIRNAWAIITAAVFEVATELITLPPEVKAAGGYAMLAHYNPANGNWMDMFQMMTAVQGYVMTDTFTKLASSSHDMVRSCDTYKRLMDEFSIAQSSLGNFTYKYGYYYAVADLAQKNQLGASGENIELPQIDPRAFVDAAVPAVQLPAANSGSDSDSKTSTSTSASTEVQKNPK